MHKCELKIETDHEHEYKTDHEKLIRMKTDHEHESKIANLGGKQILVGAPSTHGTMVDSFALLVFIFFFGGSVHTQ
jgi:hypothetical protein